MLSTIMSWVGMVLAIVTTAGASTVTVTSCEAMSPSGSRADTVTSVSPAALAAISMVALSSPVTRAVATAVSALEAA